MNVSVGMWLGFFFLNRGIKKLRKNMDSIRSIGGGIKTNPKT